MRQSNGFFVAIGHTPNTDSSRGILEMARTAISVRAGHDADEDPRRLRRRRRRGLRVPPGHHGSRTGCMAALDAERWLTHGDAAS